MGAWEDGFEAGQRAADALHEATIAYLREQIEALRAREPAYPRGVLCPLCFADIAAVEHLPGCPTNRGVKYTLGQFQAVNGR